MRELKTVDSGLLTSPVNTEQESSFVESATAPVRFLFKLYQTALQEREMREITVKPAQGRAHLSQGVVVREPVASTKLTFHDLPVSCSIHFIPTVVYKLFWSCRSTCSTMIDPCTALERCWTEKIADLRSRERRKMLNLYNCAP